MAQVAFDTQEFVDTLEKEGLPRNQAKAISLVVRKSHEVADLATKRDLEDVRKDVEARFDKTDAKITDVRKDLSTEIADVRKDLSTEIADVRKDMEYRFDKNEAQMEARFEKVETQIADVRKDLSADIALVRKDLSAEISLIRKDMEALTNSLLIKMVGAMAAIVGIAAAIIKLF